MRAITLPILLLIFVSPVVMGQEPSIDKPAESSEQVEIREFQLTHARAENVAQILIEQFPSIKFSSDRLTNMIYAPITDSEAKEVLTLMSRLEEGAKNLQRREQKAKEKDEKGKLLQQAIIKLKHVDAHEMEESLIKLGLAKSGSVAAGPSGNVIALSFPEDQLQRMIQIVDRFDTPSNAHDLQDNRSSADTDRIVYNDLVPLVVELQQTIAEFGSNHPKARALKKQIEITRRALSGELPTTTDDQLKSQKSAEYAALETEITKVMDDWRQRQSKQPTVDDIAPIKNDLTELVGKLFELRQKTEESQWKQANDQLLGIRKRLDDRKKNREAIIEKRVEALLEED